jgi:hypothetical protein
VEVAKYNRDREEDKINRLPHKQTNQLDDLGKEHERELQSQRDPLMLWRPGLCGLDGQEDDEGIEGNGQRCERSNM